MEEVKLLPEFAESARDNAVRKGLELFYTGSRTNHLPYPITKKLIIATMDMDNAKQIQSVIDGNDIAGHVVVLLHKPDIQDRSITVIDDFVKAITNLEESIINSTIAINDMKRNNNRFKRSQHFKINKFF